MKKELAETLMRLSDPDYEEYSEKKLKRLTVAEQMERDDDDEIDQTGFLELQDASAEDESQDKLVLTAAAAQSSLVKRSKRKKIKKHKKEPNGPSEEPPDYCSYSNYNESKEATLAEQIREKMMKHAER